MASRRKFMKFGLSASTVATVAPAMLLAPSPGRAALGPGPKKLLTFYVPGGWEPYLYFCPLTTANILSKFPEPGSVSREPVWFSPDQLQNLDGSGNAPNDEESQFQRLRAPHLWDPAAMAAGARSGSGFSDFGYAWKHYGLHEQSCVVHGVDQGTASHNSGRVSAMCGIAGARYRSPAIHAIVAAELNAMFGSSRPLGSVAIGRAPVPNSLDLPPSAVPTVVPDVPSLENTLSDREDQSWLGLREREKRDYFNFDGSGPAKSLPTTDMTDFALRQTQRLQGQTNATTDAFLEGIYEGYRGYSATMARDVVSELESTMGWEGERPFWASGDNPYSVMLGHGDSQDGGQTWAPQFELALKLLKSDLCSAVAVEAPGHRGATFDTHAAGHNSQFINGRIVFDVIGRLLGEMKNTPTTGGSTLLDDTLVLVVSEFGRTWPPGNSCDHWPYTSVAFAGGNLRGNRMIGDYEFGDRSSPIGSAVDLVDEGGSRITRPPRSADVIYTALRTMGIDHFLPGGPGEILGVRS